MADGKGNEFLAKFAKHIEALGAAVEMDRLGLMECVDIKTGEKVAVLVYYFNPEPGVREFVPLARMMDNPYEEVVPVRDKPEEKEPTPEAGLN
jgi:hypothetical protein